MEVLTLSNSLEDLQRSLEISALEATVTSYRSQYQERLFSATQVGSYILSQVTEDLTEVITKTVESMVFYNDTQKAVWLCCPPRDLAVLGLQHLLNATFVGSAALSKSRFSNCISSLSIKLGSLMVSHLNFTILKKKHPKALVYLEAFLKNKSRSYRQRTIRWYKKLNRIADVKATVPDQGRIGYPLLKLMIETTGLFEVIPQYLGGRTSNAVVPTAEVLRSVLEDIDRLALVQPLTLPMVCPPVPWTSPVDGGFLTIRESPMKASSHHVRSLWQSGGLQPRLGVLNRLGEIPWELNSELLALLDEAYRSNHRSVPQTDMSVEWPPRPWNTRSELRFLMAERPDVVHEWKKQVAIISNKFYSSRMVGQRIQFLHTLSVARRYQQYDTLWFPWSMDYRGRVYPLSNFLHPQADDYGRSLLRFKQRFPLTPHTDPTGWQWYLIHGANTFGEDKGSLSERRAWVRQNHQAILQCADDPWGSQMWTDADKPWCFLAWAKEYTRLIRGQQDYTQIPVALDGKCNGLQHLAATIRDEQTAALVSLLPTDKPTDIYSAVQREVERRLPEDSPWKGRVTRQLVKRNTMTTPYNVTAYGMGSQIKEELLSRTEDNRLSKEVLMEVPELRDTNYSAIHSLLGRTAKLMAWYNRVAGVYMSEGLQIGWRLPDGFCVLQDLQDTKTYQIRLESRTVVINYRRHTGLQSRSKNASATSPNITHSMDATHMAMVLRALPPDVPIAAIHDSFGLPAPQVHSIRDSIRNTFVELYESYSPIRALQEDYHLKTGKELPPPPEAGDLQLDLIRLAEYAFA